MSATSRPKPATVPDRTFKESVTELGKIISSVVEVRDISARLWGQEFNIRERSAVEPEAAEAALAQIEDVRNRAKAQEKGLYQTVLGHLLDIRARAQARLAVTLLPRFEDELRGVHAAIDKVFVSPTCESDAEAARWQLDRFHLQWIEYIDHDGESEEAKEDKPGRGRRDHKLTAAEFREALELVEDWEASKSEKIVFIRNRFTDPEDEKPMLRRLETGLTLRRRCLSAWKATAHLTASEFAARFIEQRYGKKPKPEEGSDNRRAITSSAGRRPDDVDGPVPGS